MFTRNDLFEKLHDGSDGRIQLPYEDACIFQKILISRGYAVLMGHGDIGDTYEVRWVYAGDVDNLDYANPNRVVFASEDYLDMLEWGDYEDETEDDCEVEKKEDSSVIDIGSCDKCVYYDDVYDDPYCENCCYNYPNKCVVK